MTITPDLFGAFLKCPTKCWLRATHEPVSGNVYGEWVNSQNETYRATEIDRHLSETPKDESVVSPPTENLKAAQWRLAVSLTGRTQISDCELETQIHAVERLPSEGRGKPAQFIPIRFIFTNKLGKDEKLVLAFDGIVLSQMLGRDVGHGRIIHGDDHTTFKVKISILAGDVRKRIEKIAALLASTTAPDLILNRHCPECEFQSRCRQKAVEKDDLSLLAGMNEKERTKLHSKGIFTVTQLSYTFRPRRRPKQMRDKREKYHHSLKALAIREKKIHIVGSPELKIEGTPVYLDVEGLPDRDFYYLIGLRIGNGEFAVQHSLWADTVVDEGRIWHDFLAILETVEKPVLIHYGSYEKSFLNCMCERYGKPPEGSAVGVVVRSGANLLSVIFAQIYFPTWSNGLKNVARWLGFNWSADDASGVQSIIWRNEWEHTKSPLSREKLIVYNLEDCAALEKVNFIVRRSCEGENKSNNKQADQLEVVNAENLDSKVTLWPKFSTTIDGFEIINKAARWDYQRDRIYIRTDSELRKAKQKIKRHVVRPKRISKVTINKRPDVCARCGRKGGRMIRSITKHLHDLRITRTGINGWVVEYQFQVFWCKYCSEFTPWPKEFWDRTRYGRNLTAFIIFETIELCVSQRSVTHTLNRLFGFQMEENVVHRLKVSGAKYYDETRKKILAKMVNGKMIHADETRIKSHGKSAFVWVFATFHEVVYFYSDTREGSLVQSTLDGFKGVLVSDFYAAYDVGVNLFL